MKKCVSIVALILLLSVVVTTFSACTFDIKNPKSLIAPLFECETCGDKGEVDCSHCNGKGDTKCILCNGKGEKDCMTCMGRGYRMCYMCGGVGGSYKYDYWLGYSTYQTCYNCIGGSVSCIKSYPCACINGKTSCMFCNGSGDADCPDCDK